MITLCRAVPRAEAGTGLEIWRTSFPDGDEPGHGAGPPVTLEECRLPPGAALPRQAPRQEQAELVTYLREGVLAYDESPGSSGVLQAGEFHRTTDGRRLLRHQENASQTAWAHLLQLALPPVSPWCSPSSETKRFSAAQRRGLLCVVASADGRRDSLRVHHDILAHSALLEPGQHVVHQLEPGRRAWLHVVLGEVTLGDLLLGTGDGAGFTAERAVSLRARVESEVLLLDLG